MAAWMILITLAAFGAFSALWVFFGFLLPAGRGGAAVCFCRSGGNEEPLIRRYLWLWNMGLVRCPLLLVDCGLTAADRTRLSKFPHVTLCPPEELSFRLEQERDLLDRTGT